MSKFKQEPIAQGGQGVVSLLKELSSAYKQGSIMKFAAGELGLLDALNSPDLEVSSTAAIKLHELGDKLNELVVKDERFPGNSVRMVCSDRGTSGFYPRFVGVPLVVRALKTGSPEAAIKWLQKVLATTAATGKIIQALWGVPVNQEIQLTNEVKIVPIGELPDSPQKQWITKDAHFQANSPIMSILDFTTPQSALIMSRRIDPFIYDPDTQPNLTHDAALEAHELPILQCWPQTMPRHAPPVSAALGMSLI